LERTQTSLSTHTTTHYTTPNSATPIPCPTNSRSPNTTKSVRFLQPRCHNDIAPGTPTSSVSIIHPSIHHVSFKPDSGATDILIRRQDSHVLHNPQHFTDANPAPAFYVANNMVIYPYATGTFRPPHTTLTILAYIFEDNDLADNLFGLAPLLNQGCTATFTGQSVSITGPPEEGNQIIFYGTKPPYANAWKLAAVRKQWLSNYPNLTLKMLNANKPHSPAARLGHITASRANVRSTRAPAKRSKHKSHAPTPSQLCQPEPINHPDSDSDSDSLTPHRILLSTRRTASFIPRNKPLIPIQYTPTLPHAKPTDVTPIQVEYLQHYMKKDRPDILLRATVLHTSEFRNNALFSDPTGRFPVTAKDGSQYLLVSVYKTYIHVEPMPSRTAHALQQAYATTHQWFKNHGHHIRIQILDNENPRALQDYFDTQLIKWQMVTPYNKRTNKAERAIQTFKRHFLSILAGGPNYYSRLNTPLT
jgi:hypothetical protein